MAISKNIPITDKNQMLKLIIISITWSGRERNFDKHEMVQLSCSPLFLGGKDYSSVTYILKGLIIISRPYQRFPTMNWG